MKPLQVGLETVNICNCYLMFPHFLPFQIFDVLSQAVSFILFIFTNLSKFRTQPTCINFLFIYINNSFDVLLST